MVNAIWVTHRISKFGRSVKTSTGRLDKTLSLSSLIHHTTGSGKRAVRFVQEDEGGLFVIHAVITTYSKRAIDTFRQFVRYVNETYLVYR